MNKKPIKRNIHIVKLSQDHHASLLFCWKLRQGIKRHADIGRMIKYVLYFREQHITPHFKEEEDILFTVVTDDMVQRAIDDHQKIKSLIQELENTDAKGCTNILTVIADTVDEHVRYEERILFPHLEEMISDEQLEMMGNQISDEPLKDNYEYNFWDKPTSL
ncbi:MAG: hemerythrin domain-containing protein [Ginsengibacter sp.]